MKFKNFFYTCNFVHQQIAAARVGADTIQFDLGHQDVFAGTVSGTIYQDDQPVCDFHDSYPAEDVVSKPDEVHLSIDYDRGIVSVDTEIEYPESCHIVANYEYSATENMST